MIIVLNGPLGIGKSTLAETLAESLDHCVMLDGDHLIAANPPPDDEMEFLHSTIALLVCGKTPFAVDDLQKFSQADAVWSVDAKDDLVQSAGLALSGRRARRTWAWRQALDVADRAAALIAPTPSASNQPIVEVGT